MAEGEKNVPLPRENRGVAQLVVYLVWDQVVARSSRVTPTRKRLFGISEGSLAFYLVVGVKIAFPKENPLQRHTELGGEVVDVVHGA